MFCKHKWEVLSEHTTESKAEQMLRLFGKCPYPPNTWALEDMTKKVRILLVTCEKCGKIRQFKTTI